MYPASNRIHLTSIFKEHSELLLQIFQKNSTVNQILIITDLLNIRCFIGFKLVPDFSDYFFQNVLHCQYPCCTTVFINYERHVHLLLLHFHHCFLDRSHFKNVWNAANEFLQLPFSAGYDMWEHFFNVYDSYNPIFTTVFDRIACVIVLIQNNYNFLVIHVFVQCYELSSRYHNVFCDSFVKGEYVLHILKLHLVNFSALKALGHNDTKLLLGVMLLMSNGFNAKQTKQNT
ncbi:hypothetical protein D3C73_1042540 [compost metagenome]